MNNQLKVTIVYKHWLWEKKTIIRAFKAHVLNGWLSMYIYNPATDAYTEEHIPSSRIERLTIVNTHYVL